MKNDSESVIKQFISKELLEVLIRFGLIILLVIICDRIFAPFWKVMLWALIISVSFYPLHQKLASKLSIKKSQGISALIIVLSVLLIIGGPMLWLGVSFSNEISSLYQEFQSPSFKVPLPSDEIRQWPIVGDKIWEAWNIAATNLPAFMEKINPHVNEFIVAITSYAKSTLGTIALFLGAMVIAGIIMAFGQSGSQAMLSVFDKLTGKHGREYQTLSVATIRSVALGVLGVAFVQAILLGIGFVLSDIPAPGILALIALLLGIIQVPAAAISLPVIIYMWATNDASIPYNLFCTVYLVLAGLSDNVLKPLLLGRGVDAPMPIILFGALGGMISAGIIGMFVGAVGLALGYQLFMAWVKNNTEQPHDEVTVCVSNELQK